MRDRAATTALNYAILLAVVSIFTSLLVVGVSGVVADQQERTVRNSLDVTGNRLANDLAAVDRLVAVGDADRVRLRSDLPRRAVGAQYAVRIEHVDGNRYRLALRSVDPETVALATFTSRTPVETGTVRGGPLVVEYDPAADEVVVNRA